jgi:nitrite reductase (NO-forming)
MLTYLILEAVTSIIAIVAIVIFLLHLWENKVFHKIFAQKGIYIPLVLAVIAVGAWALVNRAHSPQFTLPVWMHSHAPGGIPPSIPFGNIIDFFENQRNFERIADIGTEASDLPTTPLAPDADGIVRIALTVNEVISEISPGIYYNYWTFNKKVPGPMLRIKEGDIVEVALTNDKSSIHAHNIDLHSVTGPGGGAVLTEVLPGETKTFRFKALNPGLYIYHCAMPNVSTHNSHGQYGLILVEPKEGLPAVDKEFYVVQGELYTTGDIGKKGLVPFDSHALVDGTPNYVTFNGKIEKTPRLKANVGDRVRIYVGNGGVNLISSFHVIGEIFDTVYPEGAIGTSSAKLQNVQTTAVLPGGSSIVEFTADVPGKYLLVDHALARMNKGAWATLVVEGEDRPEIFAPVE